MSAPLQEELREAIKTIRVKPYPIVDLIPLMQKSADLIQQQQAEIEALKKFNKAILKKGGFPYPLLTDEEIEEVINRTYWIGTEDEIRVKIAKAILRKAQEK